MLIGIIVVGASIDFTKFATAGAIAVTTIQKIAGSFHTRFFDGYITSIFSFFQLIGGILMGLVGIRYFSKLIIYLFGAIFFISYQIVVIVITANVKNPFNSGLYYLIAQSLNGFGYGILYNLLIAHVLSLGFKTKKFSPLGLYQSLAALSIAGGTFFSSAINSFLKQDFANTQLIINITLMIVATMMALAYYLVNYIELGFQNKRL